MYIDTKIELGMPAEYGYRRRQDSKRTAPRTTHTKGISELPCCIPLGFHAHALSQTQVYLMFSNMLGKSQLEAHLVLFT